MFRKTWSPLLLLLLLFTSIQVHCDNSKFLISNQYLTNGTPLRLGFLSYFRDGIGKNIAGAIPLAVQQINRNKRVLPNNKLEFIVGDCGKQSSYMCIKKMTKMNHSIKAFIGPDESCVSEALVAAAWNIPMISCKCIDQGLSDKSIYPTFARTLPPSSKISKSVISLLKYYEWKRFVLIVLKNPANKQVEESLSKLAYEQKIQISEIFYLPDQYISRHKQMIEQIVEASYQTTRIYVLLTDTFVLVDFIRCMKRKRLLDTGIYAIVSVEEEVFYSVEKGEYLNQQYQNLTSENEHIDLRGLLIITASPPMNPNYAEFQANVTELNRKDPFFIPYNDKIAIHVPIYAGLAFDAVTVIAKAFDKVIRNKQDINNGTEVIEALKNMSYKSILGFNVHIDENGDAEGNYTLLTIEIVNKSIELQIVGSFHQTDNQLPELKLNEPLMWYGNGRLSSEPSCGFSNEFCDNGISTRLVLALSVFFVFLLILIFFIFKHYHYEYKLTKVLWKVDLKDVVIINTNSEYALQNIRNTINIQGLKQSNVFLNDNTNNKNERTDNSSFDLLDHKGSGIGIYRGSAVFIKRICKKSIDLTRNVRKELIQMREMRHENINSFIGASIDAPCISILFVYCARGSLEDVIKNKDLDLDNMFVASLVADLLKGMIYLHDSEIISHGNLKPSNCLIDSRWVLQITNYGLHEFKSNQELCRTKESVEKNLLWKAPEILRNANPPARGTQKGDVYSFALILYEIILRKNPFEDITLTNQEILHRVINPKLYGGMFRPKMEHLKCAPYITKCIEECWKENPEERPEFRYINIRLREMQAGLKPNIFDNMIAILEKYSYNLESLVQERTKQLSEEKKKTENLLLRMLPKSAAEQLKRGEAVEAEYFECVTIYFSDIVGFTELSAVSTPIQVVNLLNDLYTCFDSIIGNYDVYKVETIGDAYMVVSGLPIRNGDKHAGEIASMALHLLKEIFNFEIAHRPGEYLKLRIGIHSGRCVSGVVGLKMPRYCLFGDTVNVASRMESTGHGTSVSFSVAKLASIHLTQLAHKIHVSYSCKQILDKLGGYNLEERGLVSIKGKGQMKTYWLLSSDGGRS